MTSWFKWYSDEYNLAMRNWFEKVKRKKLNPKPQSITKNEFEALLKQITAENGVRYYDGVKDKRTFYREWLKNAFLIALLTGRRREEISNLSWNLVDMKEGIITIEDFKVNRIQKRVSNDEKKLIHIPITQELEDLLYKLGYEEKKDTNQYLLANEVKISRKKVMGDILSRGFSHYYNQLKTGRKLTFKSLRKTYITSLQLQMGANTKMITGHPDNGVIERNYIDKIKIAKAARNTSVFQEESEREMELNKLRKASNGNQKNKDLNI
ncbi:MAG: tyrosine-type recombinase/integrase [Bacteroidetes bacterium]|nr:tyrosine-type recombinase/integrase [Bacteroidota bacterium]